MAHSAGNLPRQIVIIGSGVIGLTAAYELSKAYKKEELAITIIARDTPRNGLNSTGWASPWAGANWYPFLNQDPQNRWESISYRKYKTEVPKDFIMFMPAKYYTTRESEVLMKDLWYGDVVGGIRTLEKPYPEFTDGTSVVGSAVEFTTLTVCVPPYLMWLQDELTERGVKFVEGWVGSISDVQYVPGSNRQVKTDVVINATGLGAKDIVGIADPLVHPIRGQTVLVRAPSVNWCFMVMSPTQATYMIPRKNGDVILGGTYGAGDWNVSPDPEVARGILERSLMYCPELAQRSDGTAPPNVADIKVLRHNVGLRPARVGGARVEKETVTIGSGESAWNGIAPLASGLDAGHSVSDVDSRPKDTETAINVVHAYGVGPAGYQESWGVAEDVLKLTREFLQELN